MTHQMKTVALSLGLMTAAQAQPSLPDENAVRQPKAVGPVDSHGGNASSKAGMSDALGVTALHDRLPVDVAWNE